MASVEMPNSKPCQFDAKGWVPCKKPTDNGWCDEHEKTKCVSCGGKAVRSCGEGMGGLCCGAPLCETCQHNAEGGHVVAATAAVLDEERRVFEETGVESPRMLAKRGLPTGLPSNLKVILDGDRKGWTIKRCWALELNHGLMGFFPAQTKRKEIMAIVTDKPLIFRIWKSLQPKNSKIMEFECMVNDAGTVAYAMKTDSFDQKRSTPHKVFTAAEIEQLFAKDKEPFEWAPGLIGARVDPQQFKWIIERAEKGEAA